MEYNARNAMEWSRLSSRKVLGSVFCQLAQEKDFIVMVADVASSTSLGDFVSQYPERFINVGIAETNMVAMATGIAETGKNVFAMTFAPFASMRCFEAVRTYVGYMNANVKIIGLASGLSMGVGGNTHFGLEDVSLMRTIPGMTVVSPADCTETVKTIEKLWTLGVLCILGLRVLTETQLYTKMIMILPLEKGTFYEKGSELS